MAPTPEILYVLWRKTKNCPDKLLNIHVTIKESKIFVPGILMEAWLKWNKRVLMAKSNNSDRKVKSISFATSINFIPGNKEWLSKRSKRDTDSGKWISTATAKEMMTVESIYLFLLLWLSYNKDSGKLWVTGYKMSMLLSQLVNYCFWMCAVTYIPGRNCTFSSLMEAYTSSERMD